MAKYTNVVRFKVKAGKQKEFEEILDSSQMLEGQVLPILAKTGNQSYVAYGLWESEGSMVDARPQMISLLDSARHLLEELSPDLGVTDPVSGTVISEKSLS